MQNIDFITSSDELTNKYFKHVCKAPFWLEDSYDEIIRKNRGKEEPIRFLEIPSLSSFKKYMVESSESENFKSAICQASADVKENDWAGTKDWAEYLTLLENGDERVIDEIKADTETAVKELEHKYEQVLSHYSYDVTGEFFDIGLVLSGVPEVWLEPEFKENEGEKPQVALRIDMDFTGGVQSRDVIRNGGRVIAMAKILERMGCEVSIELVNIFNKWTDSGEAEVTITSLMAKNYNESINYKKLSSLLTTAYVRRAQFRMMEVMRPKDLSSGYGSSIHLDGFVRIDRPEAIDILEKRLFKEFTNGND